jgi:diaminopimelate decarboxylase
MKKQNIEETSGTTSAKERRPYSRPVIRKQYMGAANKFGGYSVPEPITKIDGVSIDSLVERFGSPLFVFSENTLRRKVRELNQAFTSRYPSFQAAWSYKTNYLDAVCNVFHSEGSWAEVVSGFEYLKARHNGIPGERIIFNGPYKKYEILKQAVIEGARIHADHLDEIRDLKQIAQELGRPVEIALRLNLDTGTLPQWSRFGFNLESGHALEAARIAIADNLKIIGVHSHIGTFMFETAPYRKAAQKVSKFYKQLRDELGQPLRYIDLGGGFASKNKLKAHYKIDQSWLPSFDAYAEAICDTLYESFPGEEPPQLFLETGRALVDEAGFLVASVIGNKTLATGQRALILDAGVNLLYTSTWYDLKVSPTQVYSGTWEDVVLYGPLCMNIDVVRERCLLPNLHRGEQVVIHPVGAYNVTQAMQFIEMKPTVVMVEKSGEVKMIKRRETMEDMVALETE